MSGSTLDSDVNPVRHKPENREGKGHDTGSLGPSDTSDSGSDIAAAPGTVDEQTPFDANVTAGAEIGDVDLDSDSDSVGTGERIAAGKDPIEGVNHDQGFDRIVGPEEAGLGAGLHQAEEAQSGVRDRDHTGEVDEAPVETASEVEQGQRSATRKTGSSRGLGGGADFSADAGFGGGLDRA
jgi:hypothetical protein